MPIQVHGSENTDLGIKEGSIASEIAPEVIRKEVYDEMKMQNTGNRDYVIQLLREKQGEHLDSQENCDNMSEDMKTRYTAQAIEGC